MAPSFDYGMWRSEAVALFGAAAASHGGELRVIAVEIHFDGTPRTDRPPHFVGLASTLRKAEGLTNRAGFMNVRGRGFIDFRGDEVLISVLKD